MTGASIKVSDVNNIIFKCFEALPPAPPNEPVIPQNLDCNIDFNFPLSLKRMFDTAVSACFCSLCGLARRSLFFQQTAAPTEMPTNRPSESPVGTPRPTTTMTTTTEPPTPPTKTPTKLPSTSPTLPSSIVPTRHPTAFPTQAPGKFSHTSNPTSSTINNSRANIKSSTK